MQNSHFLYFHFPLSFFLSYHSHQYSSFFYLILDILLISTAPSLEGQINKIIMLKVSHVLFVKVYCNQMRSICDIYCHLSIQGASLRLNDSPYISHRNYHTTIVSGFLIKPSLICNRYILLTKSKTLHFFIGSHIME